MENVTLVPITVKLPINSVAQPVYNTVDLEVEQSVADELVVIQEDSEGNPLETQLKIEKVLIDHLMSSADKISEYIAQIREQPILDLPSEFLYTDFIVVGTANLKVVYDFLSNNYPTAKLVSSAVGDNVTKVTAPLVKRVETEISEFPTVTEDEVHPVDEDAVESVDNLTEYEVIN